MVSYYLLVFLVCRLFQEYGGMVVAKFRRRSSKGLIDKVKINSMFVKVNLFVCTTDTTILDCSRGKLDVGKTMVSILRILF